MTSQARDLVTGVAAVVVGGVVAVIAATIPNTTGTAVGPGAFPLVVGVAVVLAGLAVAVPALRRGNGGEEEEEDEGGGKPLPTRLVLPAGIAAFCAVALTVSLTIASGAAFCLCCRYMAGYRWPRSALIGLAGAAAVRRRANWLAGRQTLATFTPLMEELDRLGERAGWRPKVAVWVLADYDAAREVAGGRLPDRALMAAFGRGGGKAGGASGGDLRGSVLLGGPPEIRADVAALRSLGADHIVFDFRFSGADTWADDVRGFRERILGTPVRPGGGSPGRGRG